MADTKSDKEWAKAVRKAVHEYRQEKDEAGKVKKVRWLNVLAAQLVTSAAGGDMTAMKEVGDRLDGKPNQLLEHKGNANVIPVVNVTINSDDKPVPAPEAGNGAAVTSH